MPSYFYYVFGPDTGDPDKPEKRAAAVIAVANTYGLESVHREDHWGMVTIQIETDDQEKAILFKLAAEMALAEGHEYPR